MDQVVSLLATSITAQSTEEIKSAEKRLTQLYTQQGFPLALLQILASNSADNFNSQQYELIRLAAVVQLSKIAKRYWCVQRTQFLIFPLNMS
jgi:hypothetical protein